MEALFPYDRYESLHGRYPIYYPANEESLARWVQGKIDGAAGKLSALLQLSLPDFEVLIVDTPDWELAPHSDAEELESPHPYMTDVTTPQTLVIPLELDSIFGKATPEKFAFMLYHELVVAFLEDDPRSWPEESTLWADEWQFAFAALWLSQTLDNVQGLVNKDEHAQYADAFEPEADGKTPITIRGFDWFEDTTTEEFLIYRLLLEQFAADLLAHYNSAILPRFLTAYRVENATFLSDDVTALLAQALGGKGAEEWLEGLVYF